MHTAQHGFTAGKSIDTNLVEITGEIANAIGNTSQLDVIYIDLSSAFDAVNHNTLLRKLLNIGLAPNLVKWFDSFMSGRTFRIKVNGATSSKANISRGVPQGSALGPLLFAIYINDLPSICEEKGVKVLLYADDIKLFKEIKKHEDVKALQEGLDAVLDWAEKNGMDINSDKTKHVTYTRKTQYIATTYDIYGTTIEKQQKIKDLGVTFDSRLMFDLHIQNIADTSRRAVCYIITNWRHINDPFVLVQMYKILVRPKMEYASLVWSSASESHLKLLESVQKKAISIIYNKLRLNHLYYDYEHLCNFFRLEFLKERRKTKDFKLIKKLLEGKVIIDYILRNIMLKVPTYITRQHNLLYTRTAAQNPVHRMVKNYNELAYSSDEG